MTSKSMSFRAPVRNAVVRIVNLFAVLAVVVATAVGTPVAAEGDAEFPGADRPGPVLNTNANNPSVAAYNRAINLFRDKKFAEALEEMRAAVRANKFGYTNLGLAYSNLCLMYLKVGKFKNAQASCSKALVVLPAYIPATINLAHAKERDAPSAE